MCRNIARLGSSMVRWIYFVLLSHHAIFILVEKIFAGIISICQNPNDILIYATCYTGISFAFNSFFIPDRVSAYVIGFFSADLIARFGDNMKWQLLWGFLILTLITNGIEIYTKYIWIPMLSGMYETIFNALCRYAHLFLGVALFFCMYECFKNIHYTSFLRLSDKYSYSIYIVHQFFILSPFSLMGIVNFQILNLIVVTFVIICAGVLLQYLSSIAVSIVTEKGFRISRNLSLD